MTPNERRPSETYSEYRERLAYSNYLDKNRAARLLWDSSRKGTYIRARHGELK